VQPSGTTLSLRGVAVSFTGAGGIIVGQEGKVLQLVRD
jgi:hypothetical protein